MFFQFPKGLDLELFKNKKVLTKIPKKIICLEDDYVSAGEASSDNNDIDIKNLNIEDLENDANLTVLSDNIINKTSDVINANININESVFDSKLNNLNITDINENQYKNYENVLNIHNLFIELSSQLEIKNYEYNRCVEKWFELTTNKEIYNIENCCIDQVFKKEIRRYFILEVRLKLNQTL